MNRTNSKILFILAFSTILHNQIIKSATADNCSSSKDLNTQQSVVTDNSEQIKAYVAETKNKAIQYIDGKVTFFADVSSIGIAALGVVALGLIGAGCGCGVVAPKDKDFILPALVFTGFGIAASVITIKTLLKKLSIEPYIVLDKEGLICNSERKFQWSQVKAVYIIKNIFNFGIEQFDVLIKDNVNKTLFEMSGDFKALSPETFLHFLAIVGYFLPTDAQCFEKQIKKH